MRVGPRAQRWLGWSAVAVVDVLAVGVGMGVPIFAIAWGFPVGWYAARDAGLFSSREPGRFRRAALGSTAIAGLTLALMAVIWAPQVKNLFDPAFNAEDWGIPLVLYTSTASFIGWLALMIVIAPILQLMASLCAAYAVAMTRPLPDRAVHLAAPDNAESDDAAR